MNMEHNFYITLSWFTFGCNSWVAYDMIDFGGKP